MFSMANSVIVGVFQGHSYLAFAVLLSLYIYLLLYDILVNY